MSGTGRNQLPMSTFRATRTQAQQQPSLAWLPACLMPGKLIQGQVKHLVCSHCTTPANPILLYASTSSLPPGHPVPPPPPRRPHLYSLAFICFSRKSAMLSTSLT